MKKKSPHSKSSNGLFMKGIAIWFCGFLSIHLSYQSVTEGRKAHLQAKLVNGTKFIEKMNSVGTIDCRLGKAPETRFGNELNQLCEKQKLFLSDLQNTSQQNLHRKFIGNKSRILFVGDEHTIESSQKSAALLNQIWPAEKIDCLFFEVKTYDPKYNDKIQGYLKTGVPPNGLKIPDRLRPFLKRIKADNIRIIPVDDPNLYFNYNKLNLSDNKSRVQLNPIEVSASEYHSYIDKRNRFMAAKISDELSQHKCQRSFFYGGSFHLTSASDVESIQHYTNLDPWTFKTIMVTSSNFVERNPIFDFLECETLFRLKQNSFFYPGKVNRRYRSTPLTSNGFGDWSDFDLVVGYGSD